MGNRTKTLIIGLDGATFDLIKPWADEGQLPTLARLMQEGSYGILHSTIPPLSVPAWPSFFTGKNPGKHGMFRFIQRVDGEYRWQIFSAANLRTPTLWDVLTAGRRRSGFFYVPGTYPARPLNGLMLSGFAPGIDSDCTYPIDLKNELVARFGRENVMEEWRLLTGRRGPLEFLHAMLKAVDNQANVVAYCVERNELDVVAAVFTQSDATQHLFWRYMDESHPMYEDAESDEVKNGILLVFQRLDSAVGRLLDIAGDDVTVLIMSDHGHGPFHKYFYLNSWLAEQGLLTYQEAQRKDASPSKALTKYMYLGIQRARKILPGRLRQALRKASQKGVLSKVRSIGLNPLTTLVDWNRTRAYSMGHEIYLNLAGREPQGTVQPGEEAESLLQDISRRLTNLKDPETGAPVVQRIYRREELYYGPTAHKSADLVVFCHANYAIPDHFEKKNGLLFERPEIDKQGLAICALHNSQVEGILITHGPNVKTGQRIEEASIMDLAPTVLYLSGLPIPQDMDGKVLTEIFTDSHLRANPVVFTERGQDPIPQLETVQTFYSDEEREELEARLRGLGYIE
jgi:predicted AlkP superfamily phosphohydrolase/phosphomutase